MTSPRTILVIDDARTTRRLITAMLAEEPPLFDTCLEAGDGEEGLAIAATERLDLVLCDLDMPRLDGFGFLARFRGDARHDTVPVLMLSGIGDTDKKVWALTRGASDYLIKPCHRDELRARVQNYLRLKLLQDELIAKNELLERIAITDPLTGLPNRRHFLARATEELERARRYGHALGILLLDLDHFKRINDTFGHHLGDAVLVAVAQVFRDQLRAADMVARYGGEEFVVCLPETDRRGALAVAERLRASIERCHVPELDRAPTISAGLASHPDDPSDTIDAILRLADGALYRAKAAGRNRVEPAG